MFFDAHTHLNNINKPYKKIVCASNLVEWKQLSSENSESVIKSFGIHPWFIENADLSILESFIKNEKCLIGECGLDALRSHANQDEVFICQLEFAKKYNKIVVIHCVKAWDKMIKILKDYNDLSFIFHRFSGSKDVIAKLPKNSYFSIGLNNLNKIQIVPDDKLLLETDDEDYDINEVYEKSGISSDVLYKNAKRLLGDLI